MKRYTHIVWDFNGTLFDDVDAGIASVNKMLCDRGISQIADREQYQKIFKFPIIDYYRDLGFDFAAESYDELAPIWVELYNENSRSSVLQSGAVDAIKFFESRGLSQILLSATELNMLKGQVCGLGIGDYFSEIYGLDNIHAYSKKQLAVRWKEENPNAVPLFVGDTEHDADVAAAIGADCVLYTGGHQSRSRLAACGVRLVDSLTEILDLL